MELHLPTENPYDLPPILAVGKEKVSYLKIAGLEFKRKIVVSAVGNLAHSHRYMVYLNVAG